MGWVHLSGDSDPPVTFRAPLPDASHVVSYSSSDCCGQRNGKSEVNLPQRLTRVTVPRRLVTTVRRDTLMDIEVYRSIVVPFDCLAYANVG